MKKRKLKLDELKVSSFVTLSKDGASETVKGGLAQPIDTVIDKDILDTVIGCKPTPATHCYHCPPEF